MCAAVVIALTKVFDAKVVKVPVEVGARDGRVSERADHDRKCRAEKRGAHKPTYTHVTGKTGRRADSHAFCSLNARITKGAYADRRH